LAVHDIRKFLEEHGILNNDNESTLIPLSPGRTAQDIYSIELNGQKLVIKGIKENEARILKVLYYLKSSLTPEIHYPELLDEKILCCTYIEPAVNPPLKFIQKP